MTCALLTVARDEDRFLEEWINHHLNLGFNHIYICDNNDYDSPLSIKNDKVTIYDMRNINFSNKICAGQYRCYCSILNDIWDKYDYCAICDVDEFFHFNNVKTVQEFIQKYIIDEGYNVAEIPWKVYDDNDLIYSINKPVVELYTKECDVMPFSWCMNEISWGKSIFKLCEGIKAYPHWPEPDTMKKCGGFKSNHITHNDAYIKHYRTKCLEDYISHKVKMQNILTGAQFSQGNVIRAYFEFNKPNIDKLLASLKLCKQYNIPINNDDKWFILRQFEIHKPITVVIRTHNRLELLKRAIHTINTQSMIPEILVLDDNSTDGTSLWLSENNISHVSMNINVGPGEILMRGRHMITTPYYIVLDDDDMWVHNHIIEDFCKEIIKDCEYDIYGDCSLHCGYLVKTDLLLKCPMVSTWHKDDWYFCWLENHAKLNKDVSIKNFFHYNLDPLDTGHASYGESISTDIMGKYYREKDLSIDEINDKYHLGDLKDRKVFDQIKNYLENSK